MRVILMFVALLLGSAANNARADALRQLDGLWTAEWTAGGNSKVEQVLFAKNVVDTRVAALPFFPGLATIKICQGLGCNGADIVVSGTGFDCLYTYSRANENQFSWSSKGGSGGCIPSSKFTRVVQQEPPPTPTVTPPPFTPPPFTPPPTVTPQPARPGSYWNYEGSTLHLQATPDHPSRIFYMYEPSSAMSAMGAKPGDLFFEGRRSGHRYEGTAYVFAGRCGRRPYSVTGTVGSDDRSVLMSGQKPEFDPTNCQERRRVFTQFELTYKYRLD
jgi:hypothetical protein